MTIADKLTVIAQNQQAIYDAGVAIGQAQGGGSYDKGYADGQKAEYDRFWDDYQDNGTRTSYSIYEGGFAGPYWTDETFKPKYDMVVTGAAMMFRATKITDLREETIGVSIDFSGCKEFNYAFAYSQGYLRYLPTINISSATNLTSAFANYGGTDLSLIVSETTVFADNTFNPATNLTTMTISGTIATSLNLKWSPSLSNASVQNIIDCLKDLSGATAQKLTLHKTVVANMTQAQKDAISAKNWTLVSG